MLSFHWIRETVQIEVITVRPNFHVNISEQFMIHKHMRPSLVDLVQVHVKRVNFFWIFCLKINEPGKT